MTDSRELDVDQWTAITNSSRRLFTLIGAFMDDLAAGLDAGQLPAEWSELYDLHRLANVITDMAARYRVRARDRADLQAQTAPVPYLPVITEAEREAEIRHMHDHAGDNFPAPLAAGLPAPLADEGVYKLRGSWDGCSYSLGDYAGGEKPW